MKRARFTTDQIVAILGEARAGLPVKDLLRKHGISEQTYYRWKAKYGEMAAGDARRLKELETENARLKTMLADAMLDAKVLKDLLSRKW
jgi:putative transposase